MWRYIVKIRNGFVSNSSSSSFVLIISVDDCQKVLDRLNNPVTNRIVHDLKEHHVFGGADVISLYTESTDGYHTILYMNEQEDYSNEVREYLTTMDNKYDDLNNTEIQEAVVSLSWDDFVSAVAEDNGVQKIELYNCS